MNIDHFRKILESKREELLSEITTVEIEARDSGVADVGDPIDDVTASQAQAGAFEVSTGRAKTLRAVEDALQRIENGTYGNCIDCGRPIGEARLEAVPWTPYCRDDQEKHDREEQPAPGILTE